MCKSLWSLLAYMDLLFSTFLCTKKSLLSDVFCGFANFFFSSPGKKNALTLTKDVFTGKQTVVGRGDDASQKLRKENLVI